MTTFTATRVQVATYLLGVCPFSIAFLVFLNASVSFVITDLIGREDGVGNAVGNLGFADELVALVACPFWGLLSDRIGVRTVCVIGYAIICLALVLFVQARNVYPQLLLGRLFFSIGGAAASTMVTAVLPTMSYRDELAGSADTGLTRNGHTQAPSITSELTITPARFRTTSQEDPAASSTSAPHEQSASASRIAGFVGMFTGFGALLALFVFLPLPAAFQKRGMQPGNALKHSYYIVAAIAFVLSTACFFGLRNLKSEINKNRPYLSREVPGTTFSGACRRQVLETANMLGLALSAGVRQIDIGIGYLGGFVARASSVGIATFIPLLVNAMFTSSGLCRGSKPGDTPVGLPDIKRQCPRAYVVAAELTGVSQLVALLAAPAFGYWSAKSSRKGFPLATASLAGVIGYPLFVAQFDPDDNDKTARAISFVAVCLIGLSQIGAIVCSLSSLASGVLAGADSDASSQPTINTQDHALEQGTEQVPLIGKQKHHIPLAKVKGSIAGIYSFFGGAAILVLTKAGGALFDSVSVGAPFYIMAGFNGILFVASLVISFLHFPLRAQG